MHHLADISYCVFILSEEGVDLSVCEGKSRQ